MRPISTELLEKINKKYQTIYENANPELKVLLSRGFSKDLFRVYTIHEKDNIAEIDVTAKRSQADEDPDKLYVIYIENGVAHVKSKDLPYDELIPWTYEFELGSASNVAIDFDGYWERPLGETRFNLVADEYPWVFKVNSGILTAQYWQDSSFQLSTNVVKLRVIRGWKSTIKPTDDQGILVVYTKTDGHVYYRNYCMQSDGTKSWEAEREITELPTDTVDLALFRTNDYRVGIVTQDSSDNVSYIVTERAWAGMAIPAESISVAPVGLEVDLIPIEYIDGFANDETISVAPTSLDMTRLWGVETLPIEVKNVESIVEQIEAEIKVANGTLTEFITVWYPLVENSETVYLDGVEQTKNIDYTIDYTTGTITFTTAPSDGVSVSASYDWYSYGHKIKITFDHGIQNLVGQEGSISIEDSGSNAFGCLSTEEGDTNSFNTSFTGTKELILNTQNFNEMDISLDIDYNSGSLQGEAEQSVGDFNVNLIPTNLITPRYMVDPPEVQSIWNE